MLQIFTKPLLESTEMNRNIKSTAVYDPVNHYQAAIYFCLQAPQVKEF